MFILTIFSNVLRLYFLLLYISVLVDLVFLSTYILFFLLIIIIYIFKVQYPMYISIRVQWTVHTMAV